MFETWLTKVSYKSIDIRVWYKKSSVYDYGVIDKILVYSLLLFVRKNKKVVPL